MSYSVHKYFLLVFFYLLLSAAYAQKQTHQWYFGKKVGLNFNQSPPQLLFNGAVNAVEGTASIADANGQLLFYTNGLSVVNKEHSIMLNGEAIQGDLSSTNNTVIAPMPGNDSIYYLFTIGATSQPLKGFRYSIINMSGDNGRGVVTQKNLLVDDESYEKLAAVRHCNRRDVWITIKKWNTDQYYTYLLSSTGFDANPRISSTGLIIGGYENNALGAIKFSSDGSKMIALHSFENDLAELMDFDNTTGLLSNPVRFKPNIVPIGTAFTGVYGAAFSPDNRLLYISSKKSNTELSVVYQFDITNMNETAIMNSRQVIASHDKWSAGALQTGPDGKIYFSMWEDTALSVINNPNIVGPGCNYVYNALRFASAGDPIQFGLPNFIASDVDSNFTPFDFSHQGNCSSFDIQFDINKTIGLDSVEWNFGDGNISTAYDPLHSYANAGVYTVSLRVFKNDCGAASEIITHKVNVALSNLSNFLPTDTSFCIIPNYTIRISTAGANYLWSTGESTAQITVNNAGLYWLQITNNGCTFRDSMLITQKPSANVTLGNDVLVCLNRPALITANTTASNFLWSTGSTNPSIEINSPGKYWVRVTNAFGCVASDTLQSNFDDCESFIPSAFSPNGDGLNELFGLTNGLNSTIYSFYIYNRYGQLVFTSNDSFKKWDGRVKGKPAPIGSYVWMMTYKNRAGFIQTDKGTVMLIR